MEGKEEISGGEFEEECGDIEGVEGDKTEYNEETGFMGMRSLAAIF